MNKMNKIIIIFALFVILIVIALINIRSKTNTTNNPPATKNSVKAEATLPTPKITTVKLTDKGFDPKTVKIKIGEAVTWINESGNEASVNSTNHPTHKLYPILNLGLFNTGSSVQTQFASKGNFEYHNHLIPSQTGTVIVE